MPPEAVKTAHGHEPRRLAEHSLAHLTSAISSDDGRLLPEGAVGAVVGIWRDGEAYEMEFQRPFHAVLTIAAGRLAPV